MKCAVGSSHAVGIIEIVRFCVRNYFTGRYHYCVRQQQVNLIPRKFSLRFCNQLANSKMTFTKTAKMYGGVENVIATIGSCGMDT